MFGTRLASWQRGSLNMSTKVIILILVMLAVARSLASLEGRLTKVSIPTISNK
jgi:hypothetical protein